MEKDPMSQVIAEVLESGQSKELSSVQSEEFLRSYFERVSGEIEHIRSEQRRAINETGNITLA